MKLRSAPGEVLDLVEQKGESFIVERNGHQMACLVPVSVFLPDIETARLNYEFEQLQLHDERHYRTSISDGEVKLIFPAEGPDKNMTLTINLPPSYPNACPTVSADPLPDRCPHRWQDGSLCIFGAVEMWNPGQHNVLYVLSLARRWVAHFALWQKSGKWDEDKRNA